MLYKLWPIAMVALLAAPLFFSCAGNQASIPVTPEVYEIQATPNPVANHALEPSGNNRNLVGFWIVVVSEDQKSVEILPQRTAEFHMNAVQMLEVTPCTNCLKIGNLAQVPPDMLSLDLTIKHPYATGVMLTGFDPRAIFISDSDTSFPVSGRTVNLGNMAPRLLDPDGYTQIFNQVEFSSPGPEWLRYFKGKFAFGTGFDATLNPFIAYSKTVQRRMLLAGSEQTANITIQKPTGAFQFGYAVDFSWMKKTGTSGDPAVDFPPGANVIEAFEIRADQTTTLFDTSGSTCTMQVDVFDHQGQSTIDSVLVEVPGLYNGVKTGVFVSQIDTEQFRYTVELENQNGLTMGEYPALIRVIDTVDDTQSGQIDAWHLTEVTVTQDTSTPPVAIAFVQSGPYEINVSINFFNDGSYDPDGGVITKYEWDWDNDGIFDEEAEATSHSWDTPGLKQIQFRVTDDESQTDVLDDPIEITINTIPPVAMAGISDGPYFTGDSVNFFDDGSYDPDGGLITLYEWDWDNDGTYDETGADVNHSWSEAGTKTIQFRVTDDDAETDELDSPIEIEVEILLVDPIAEIEVSTYVQNTGQPVTFTGLGYDPDGGDVVSHEWDWDNDGTYDEEGEVVNHTWLTAGIYQVQYKVTDDDAQWAELAEPVDIEIKDPSGWTVAWGSTYFVTDDESGFSVDLDDLGNVYVTGICRPDQIDFDPGPGTENYNTGEDFATYLSKFDSSGNFQWVRVWSYGDSYVSGAFFMNETPLLAYSNDGYIYVTGAFDGTVDFDPGPGTSNYTGYTKLGFFTNYISRFDTSGNYYWTRTWDTDSPSEIVADENGDVYMTGAFTYTTDFDPTGSAFSLTSNGQHDAYVVKVTSAGAFAWAKSWGGNYEDCGISLASDQSGNIIVSGEIYGSVDMNPDAGVDTKSDPGGEEGAFITKFNLAGEYQWSTIWGPEFAFGLGPRRLSPVTASSGGNIYVGGLIEAGTYDFDPGAGVEVHALPNIQNGFISTFNSSGVFVRVSIFEANQSTNHYLVPQRLDTNSSGDLFVTGLMIGYVDFDPGAGVYDLGSDDTTFSPHIFSLDSSGVLRWAGWYETQGTYAEAQGSGIGIAVDEAGTTYISGFMNKGMDYDPGPGTQTVSPGSHSWLSMMPANGEW